MRATSTDPIALGVVHHQPDRRLAAVLPHSQVVRVVAEVEFELLNGEDLYDVAIVDTGAPMCVVPQWIWQQCDVTILGNHSVKGIGLPPVRPVPTHLGRIGMWLLDEGRRAAHLRPVVHLVQSDDVPLLLGIHEVLSRFRMTVDFVAKSGHLITHETGTQDIHTP